MPYKKHIVRWLLAMSIVACLGAVARLAGAKSKPKAQAAKQATATLPLEAVLKLHQKNREDAQRQQDKPPVAASITSLQFDGRLLDRALSVKVAARVSVLDDAWVSVKLLAIDAAMKVSSIPTLDGGDLTIRDGWLTFVTRRTGNHLVELEFLLQAKRKGKRATVRFEHGAAAMSRLQLRYDPHLFRVQPAGGIQRADGLQLYPQGRSYQLSWDQLKPSRSVKAARKELQRPPTEPVIVEANASAVATLDGRRITRVLYRLRFEGKQNLKLTIPQGQKLTKVFLNGARQPAQVDHGQLELQVTPARAGGQETTLELVLLKKQQPYALSGRLDYRLPRASWGINDLFVTLHLPPVFTYKWTGGSLAEVPEVAEADYSYDIPTPGRKVHLHQQLVFEAAHTQLSYTADLKGNYYR